MASFWSNNVATNSDIGSFGFDVDDGCGSDGGGVCGCSFAAVNVCGGIVVIILDGGGSGGDDDDEAATGGGCEGVVVDWLVLLRFRGWY